ncbi:hypothetical protein ACFLY7_00440 [Patescibacteria group bacterium]
MDFLIKKENKIFYVEYIQILKKTILKLMKLAIKLEVKIVLSRILV